MATRLVLPFADVGSGIKPADGAQLFFSDTGLPFSSKPRDTFTDGGAGTPNANPVIANSNGLFPEIYIAGSYRLVLKDKNNVQIWSADNVNEFATISSAAFPKNETTLAAAAARTDLVVNDVLIIKNRTVASGAELTADVVLTSGVTPNTFDIVIGTGDALLSLVIRVKKGRIDTALFGVGDGVVADAGAITRAIDFATAGDTIVLPGGPVNFGTTTFDTIAKLVHWDGAGAANYDAPGTAGTMVSYSGTDAALMLNNSASCSNMAISGTGVAPYALRVGNNTGSGAKSWGGKLSNIMLTGATTAGLHETANQLGYMEKVYCQSNTGAGKITETLDNTHGTYDACRFFNNSKEGVLYVASTSFANQKYYGCHFEGNGFEGLKNELDGLNGMLMSGCWVEGNNTDGTHTSGFYNVLLNNANNVRCEIRNTMFNGATTSNNSHIGLKGELTIGGNTYQGTSTATLVDFKGINDVLINDNDELATVGGGTVKLNSVNNRYINKNRNEIIHFDDNRLVGGGGTTLARLSGCTLTNRGAVGTTTFALPPDSPGVDIRFSAVAVQIMTLDPNGTNEIIPTGTGAGTTISCTAVEGSSIIIESVGNGKWQEMAKTGTWASP